MSAHPAEILARHGLKDLDVQFLAKPFTRAELLTKVKAALRHHGESDSLMVERRKRRRLKGK
jgi:DNA-binding response OmpR family regulator